VNSIHEAGNNSYINQNAILLNHEEFYKVYGRNKRLATFTLGCKVNQYDTEATIEIFKSAMYEVVDFGEYADVYIVNTCTVTHLSDRKCRQMLRKTKKLNPNSLLIAMGCYAQSAGEELKAEVEEVDLIVGTHHRKEILSSITNYIQENTLNPIEDIMNIDEFEELQISTMDERTRVYLKIQEGCNNYCSYCIIPYVRGKIRSRQEQNVVEEATRLAKAGFKEMVLTGIHVASYGKDLGNTSLLEVIKKLHQVEGIERIRLSSIEPMVLTDDFIREIMHLPKLCKYFHLSLQSGSDTVLKRMNRKYTTSMYEESVEKLRKVWPDVGITTDLIVGFPGETQEEFEETVAFAQKIGFTKVHIFPFSPRKGTPAAKMLNQIEPVIKEKRVKVLQQETHKIEQNILTNQVGKTVEVLFENSHSEYTYGYTSNYLKVGVTFDKTLENTLHQVLIESYEDDVLKGKVLN
jgi:threonylcarbamoyladenosine tRNA methylthiotransferase MtaB